MWLICYLYRVEDRKNEEKGKRRKEEKNRETDIGMKSDFLLYTHYKYLK